MKAGLREIQTMVIQEEPDLWWLRDTMSINSLAVSCQPHHGSLTMDVSHGCPSSNHCGNF